jgi:hypothetical protein
MSNSQNENASTAGGAHVDQAGGPKATGQKKALHCGANHISKFVGEIESVGLRLRSAAGDTQLATLPKVLGYLGSRGANTYELVALGYLRAATRVKDLEDRYSIASLREDVVGPDGLLHKRVARYVLLGQRKNLTPAQSQLDLGVA